MAVKIGPFLVRRQPSIASFFGHSVTTEAPRGSLPHTVTQRVSAEAKKTLAELLSLINKSAPLATAFPPRALVRAV